MGKPPTDWGEFTQNVVFYIILLGLTMAAFFVLKLPLLFALMWGVAILGFLFLARQALQLSSGDTKQRLKLQAQMETYRQRATAYQKQIDDLLKKPSASQSVYNQRLQTQVKEWAGAIEKLLAQISAYQQDPLIAKDIKEVPQAISGLEERLLSETDPETEKQLNEALENRRKQLESLNELQTVIKRAEIQVESTVSMLGTIYSQLLTGQSAHHVADYDRISENVDEEVARLNDHLQALREVRLG